MAKPSRLLSQPEIPEDEYYALGEDSDWEYLDGRLVMSPASDLHEDLALFLASLLRFFADARKLGIVRSSRYPMRLDERWSPEPDVMVVLEQHRHRMTSRHLDGPADFVVEIASESDPTFEQREKLPRYEQAGVSEIWLLLPFKKTLVVKRKTAEGYETAQLSSGRIESSVLSGFWIEVGWLWEDPLPSTFACFREILA